jgi:CBS domain-containing protein
MRVQISEIMTRDPACCTPDGGLKEVAQMMKDCDCGAIPVVDNMGNKKPIGIITDRDITIRAVAEGKNPLELRVADCMTPGVATVSLDEKLDECLEKMETNKIRRIIVVDSDGRCCGIVAQADIARSGDKKKTGEVVQEVSQPA